MTALGRIGHAYDPVVYPVIASAIEAYVAAVEEDSTVWGEVAPPMFAVVYAAGATAAGLFDPELAIDFAHLVHGAQAFTWPGPVVRAGDEITTVATVQEIRETAGLTFYVFATESTNQHGVTVARGVWTNIVRGES
jgi:acyl dehydratase